MGCDIHTVWEIQGGDGKWVCQDEFDTRVDDVAGDTSMEVAVWGDELLQGRDYELFGILAGVRSYEVDPIAECRGVPVDASMDVKLWVNRFGQDGHSHSWYSLAELMRYDWEPRCEIMTRAIPKMVAGSGGIGYERVRMVFFFDN